MRRRFIQCDVFTSTPTKGNALAVVVEGDGLTDAQMQSFAQWTNLAETTFLMPPVDPTADYKVRIFTPTREMPFAGHPTLGSCMSWLATGGVAKNPDRIKQECGVGIIDIDVTGDVPAFAAPPTDISPMDSDEKQRIMSRLDIGAEHVLASAQLINGPTWQVFELDSSQRVLAIKSSKVKWPEFKAIGLIGRKTHNAHSDFEVRMLAPSSGMSEDPITGSLNAAIACWFKSAGRVNNQDRPVIVSQGSCIGRKGIVSIDYRSDGQILIGGEVHILVEGYVTL